MVIETALYNYLSSYMGLTDLVSNRIYFMKMPQNPTFPNVVLQKISAPRLHGFSADYGVSTRMQITSWGTKYSDVSAVFEQIRSALQNYTNQTMGGAGGVNVKAVILDDETDGYEDLTMYFRKDADYIIWHEET